MAEFFEDGWKDISDELYVPLKSDGFFSGTIHPKDGLIFRRNMVLRAAFMPYRPKQDPAVLRIVGAKGEKLAGLDNAPIDELMGLTQNPQLFQVSGWNYGLDSIARASCGK